MVFINFKVVWLKMCSIIMSALQNAFFRTVEVNEAGPCCSKTFRAVSSVWHRFKGGQRSFRNEEQGRLPMSPPGGCWHGVAQQKRDSMWNWCRELTWFCLAAPAQEAGATVRRTGTQGPTLAVLG